MAKWLGNEDFESERLVAYEIGDRWQPLEKLSFDLALFYNDYDRLASLEFGEPFIDTDGRTVIPVTGENLTTGRTYGAELLVEWQPVDDWRLTASYSHIDMNLDPEGQDLNRGEWQEDATPRNIAGLRSFSVIQMRRTMPLPAFTSASVSFSPALSGTNAAPLRPAFAIAPLPRSPAGFSGLAQRVSTPSGMTYRSCANAPLATSNAATTVGDFDACMAPPGAAR